MGSTGSFVLKKYITNMMFRKMFLVILSVYSCLAEASNPESPVLRRLLADIEANHGMPARRRLFGDSGQGDWTCPRCNRKGNLSSEKYCAGECGYMNPDIQGRYG